MKSTDFITETVQFKSRPEWHTRMVELGAEDFLNDPEFDEMHKTDLVYAIGTDGMLKGTWSNNRNIGTEYVGKSGTGMKFYKGHGKTARKFRKSDI